VKDLGREFSKKKVAIKISRVDEIDMLQKFINERLFEDTSILYSQSYHGVYDRWIQKGYNLAVGMINEQVEVLTVERFVQDGFEIVSVEEFVDNVKRS